MGAIIMNREQMYNMLGIFKQNGKAWFYLIKPGSRHAVLLILDNSGHELARKEFGTNPSAWDMHSPAKNTINPLDTAGELMEKNVKDAEEFLQALKELEVTAKGMASY